MSATALKEKLTNELNASYVVSWITKMLSYWHDFAHCTFLRMLKTHPVGVVKALKQWWYQLSLKANGYLNVTGWSMSVLQKN